MTGLGKALIAELDDDDLDRLTERLAPRLASRITPAQPTEDSWLSTRGAAAHLGLTVPAIHKLTAARAIPFEQDGPGCRCWFLRSDLDAWRRGQTRTV